MISLRFYRQIPSILGDGYTWRCVVKSCLLADSVMTFRYPNKIEL